MRIIPKKTRIELMEFYLDVFELVNVTDEKFKVKDRLREFLIHSMVMVSEGWVLDSPSGVRELSKRMKFKSKGEVYNYRVRLKNKNLMFQTKEELILHPALTIKNVGKKMTFTFSIHNEFVK